MKKYLHSALLVLTALIWGAAFVAQSEGGNAVGPYTFNCVRSLIGALILLPVIRLLDALNLSGKKPSCKAERKELIKGGVCCGLCLGFASCFQQLGLYLGTAAGKAGFLTACYILIVPVLGLFLRKKCGINIWAAICMAVVGLYLLCINGTLHLQQSDTLILICAFIYALHIITVDHFAANNDPVRMSCIQFATAGIVSAIPMLLTEMHPFTGGLSLWCSSFSSGAAWIAILYAGIFSNGVAYTLQIVGQQGVNPTIASLLMSLESVFSVLAGWLLLKQSLSLREIIGCAVIFAAILLAQIPMPEKKRS